MFQSFNNYNKESNTSKHLGRLVKGCQRSWRVCHFTAYYHMCMCLFVWGKREASRCLSLFCFLVTNRHAAGSAAPFSLVLGVKNDNSFADYTSNSTGNVIVVSLLSLHIAGTSHNMSAICHTLFLAAYWQNVLASTHNMCCLQILQTLL